MLEDYGSVPRTRTVAQNHLEFLFSGYSAIFWFWGITRCSCIHVMSVNSPRYIHSLNFIKPQFIAK